MTILTMTRDASDALMPLSRRDRLIAVANAATMLYRAIDAQRRRRGLPLSCPFSWCAWEAPRARVSPATRNALRNHLIAAHATALSLMEM